MTPRIFGLLLVSLSVTPSIAAAQSISFAPPASFASTTGPYSVAIGDVNGDGIADLVVANPGVMPDGVPPAQGDGVNVLLGAGNGQYAPAIPIAAGPSPVVVALADVNNDGTVDLAVGTGGNLVMFLANGLPGLFGAPTTFAIGGAVEDITFGDFNEDGNLDIAMANDGNPARVSTLIGGGDGLFSALTHYPVGFLTLAVVVGDFDGDGNQDLAAANSNSGPPNTVSILLGNGAGAFGASTDIEAGTQPLDLAVGDFNQDGLPDLAVGTAVATVSVLLSTGGGSFAAPLVLFWDFSVPVVSIAVGDFNGDCTDDIVALLGSTSAVAFAGTGTGSFGPASLFSVGGTFNSWLAAGDLNGDSHVDLVVANRAVDTVSVMLNIGAVFAPSSLSPKNVSLNAGASRFPRVAVSGCHVYAVWEDYTVNANAADVLMARSVDRGATYSAPINISGDPSNSIGPQVVASGNHVYVLWIRPFDGELLLKASHNRGATFGPIVNVSNSFNGSENPAMAATGNNVYVAWREFAGGNAEILFSRSTNGGVTFPAGTNMSNTPQSSVGPELIAEGSKVYVAWHDETPNAEVFLRASDNFGAGFAPTVNISNNASVSQHAALAASGNLAYLAWNDTLAGNSEVSVKPIVYDGVSFNIGATFNLSANAGLSEFPNVAASGTYAYVTWQDNSTGNYEILFRALSYNGVMFTMDPSVTNLSSNAVDSKFQHLDATADSVHVAWLDFINNKFEVLLKTSDDNGASFGTTGVLSQNGQSSFEIDVAAADGSAFVTWRGNVGSNSEVFIRTQTTLVSAGAATGAGTVSFATSAGGFTAMSSMPESSLPQAGKPAGASFPYGFFNWTIANLAPGAAITVTMTFPANVAIGAEYWKVIGGTWTDVSSLLGDDDGDNVLTLTIVDGGLGDADGLVNGQITDPGAIALGGAVQLVMIEFKGPGTSPINPKSNGKLTIAIVTTAAFNAATVNAASVRFGANGTEASPTKTKIEDADGDGDLDLVLQFNTQSTGVLCGGTLARLTGSTSGGHPIEGSTGIRTVGCQ